MTSIVNKNNSVKCHFKMLYNNQKKYYWVRKNTSKNLFLSEILPKIKDDFGVDINNLEIIESSMGYNGNAITSSSNHLNYYGSFYIRTKYPHTVQGECNICYSTRILRNFYHCSHLMCDNCYESWCEHSAYRNCPICRTDEQLELNNANTIVN